MADNSPVDHGGRRYGAEHAAQIAAEYNQQLDSLLEALLQLIGGMHSSLGPANIARAPVVVLICATIKIARQKLFAQMGRQDMDAKSQLPYAMIALALGCVACSLLMYVLLDEIPWLMDFPCVLLWVILLAFITN